VPALLQVVVSLKRVKTCTATIFACLATPLAGAPPATAAGLVLLPAAIPWDQHESEFIRLAWETGLAAALGRHAEEDLRHVISWARRGLNPFSHGPLK
jgi:hypothetical protein